GQQEEDHREQTAHGGPPGTANDSTRVQHPGRAKGAVLTAEGEQEGVQFRRRRVVRDHTTGEVQSRTEPKISATQTPQWPARAWTRARASRPPTAVRAAIGSPGSARSSAASRGCRAAPRSTATAPAA